MAKKKEIKEKIITKIFVEKYDIPHFQDKEEISFIVSIDLYDMDHLTFNLNLDEIQDLEKRFFSKLLRIFGEKQKSIVEEKWKNFLHKVEEDLEYTAENLRDKVRKALKTVKVETIDFMLNYSKDKGKDK
jgi:SpoVK/Ycf46/Vps4 family AAA+-type ATPase